MVLKREQHHHQTCKQSSAKTHKLATFKDVINKKFSFEFRFIFHLALNVIPCMMLISSHVRSVRFISQLGFDSYSMHDIDIFPSKVGSVYFPAWL